MPRIPIHPRSRIAFAALRRPWRHGARALVH
jgi:hypothetical protein